MCEVCEVSGRVVLHMRSFEVKRELENKSTLVKNMRSPELDIAAIRLYSTEIHK